MLKRANIAQELIGDVRLVGSIAAPNVLRLPRRRTRMYHDFETYSDLDLVKVGTSRYARHASTKVLMLSYAFADDDPVKQWIPAEFEFRMPAEIEDALLDERIIKSAWNVRFEWNVWKNVLGIEIPIEQCRCTMVTAMSLSLPGKLEKAGTVLGIDEDKKKLARGRVLVKKFCAPRKATLAKPHTRCTWGTDPIEWKEFLLYNRQDVEAERAIWRKIRAYDLPKHEWELWFLDQKINEAGLPINMRHVRNAIEAADDISSRKLAELGDITDLENANSGKQILPWFRQQGYPFSDLKKGHIQRALEEAKKETIEYQRPEGSLMYHAESDDLWFTDTPQEVAATVVDVTGDERFEAMAKANGMWERVERGSVKVYGRSSLTEEYLLDLRMAGHKIPPGPDYEIALQLRAETAKASVKKYAAIASTVDDDHMLRGTLQFCGAGRTWRWSGRIYQPQNLAKPAPFFEKHQEMAARHIEILSPRAMELIYADPMALLSTGVRNSVQAIDGCLLIDADLNAIENRVAGWLADDRRILAVYEQDRDPYIDFATYLYEQPYDVLWEEYKAGDKTKRTLAKPPTLGCGYMLGPGHEYENEQTGEIEATGLLGYALNMGVRLTPEQSEKAVKIWRETFVEVVEYWWELEKAARRCIITGDPQEAGYIRFDRKGPFLRMILPSGRALHYVRPRIEPTRMPWGDMKDSITYEQVDERNQWSRISTHAGKIFENADQAIARDLLANGMVLAAREGIDIRLHVHDQIVAMCPERHADRQLKVLLDCMREKPWWAKTMPLGAAGSISKIYIKD